MTIHQRGWPKGMVAITNEHLANQGLPLAIQRVSDQELEITIESLQVAAVVSRNTDRTCVDMTYHYEPPHDISTTISDLQDKAEVVGRLWFDETPGVIRYKAELRGDHTEFYTMKWVIDQVCIAGACVREIMLGDVAEGLPAHCQLPQWSQRVS